MRKCKTEREHRGLELQGFPPIGKEDISRLGIAT